MIELIILGIILLLYFGYISLPSATILGGICLGGLCLTEDYSGGEASKTEIRMLDMLNEMINKPNIDATFKSIEKCDPLPNELNALNVHGQRRGCDIKYKCSNGSCPHLTLDGYNNYYKIAFEYDGPIHYTLYKDSKGMIPNEDLSSVTASGTQRKTETLMSNGIKLIQVPYTVPCHFIGEWKTILPSGKIESYLDPICQDYLGSRLADLEVLNPKYFNKYVYTNNEMKYTYNYIPIVKNPPITIYEDLKKIDDAKYSYGNGTPDFIKERENIYTIAHNNMEQMKKKYLEAILLYRIMRGGIWANIHYKTAKATFMQFAKQYNSLNKINQLFDSVFEPSWRNEIIDINKSYNNLIEFLDRQLEI